MITSVSPKLPGPQTFTFVEPFPTKIDLNLGTSTSTSSHKCPTANTTPGYQVYIGNTLPSPPHLPTQPWRKFNGGHLSAGFQLTMRLQPGAKSIMRNASIPDQSPVTDFPSGYHEVPSYMRENTGGQVAMLC